jgi:hypothetical protein
VPATSFCEYADTKPRKTPKWFALGQDRPLFAFAGLWTPWRGVQGPKSAPVDGRHELFGFLTTEANAVVAPIHLKAMPGHPDNAALPAEIMRIVATGEKEDVPHEAISLCPDQEPMLPL